MVPTAPPQSASTQPDGDAAGDRVSFLSLAFDPRTGRRIAAHFNPRQASRGLIAFCGEPRWPRRATQQIENTLCFENFFNYIIYPR